jgi:uncharacterized protein involved in exopolysaccharide biosynthesis
MTAQQAFTSVSRRPPDIEDYIDMLRRYRSWILGPTFTGLVVAVVIAFFWKDTYLSYATLRITPQQIPDKIVPSMLSLQMAERVQGMETEIRSRTVLSDIIQKPSLDLYKKERDRMPLEDVIQNMNKNLKITAVSMGGGDRRYGSAFQIQFTYPDRYKAMMVVRELVTRFQEQIFNVQKSQVKLTADFVNSELKTAKDQMDSKLGELTKFKMENQGRLPEQVTVNVSQKQTLEVQMLNINQQIGRLGQEKLLLENKLQQIKRDIEYQSANLESVVAREGPAAVKNQKLIDLHTQIMNKRAALASALNFYGENYPEVQQMKASIEELEKQESDLNKQDQIQQQNNAPQVTVQRIRNPQAEKALNDLRAEQANTQTLYASAQYEIDQANKEVAEIQKQIAECQRRIAEAPMSAQRYDQLVQDANLARQKYDDAQKARAATETAQNMEERKAGENLELLDAPNLPTAPTEPHRWAWAGAGTLLGMIAGMRLAAIREVKDASLKNLKDVRAYTNLPVLSSIPLLENGLLVRRKRRLMWLAWSSAIIVGMMLMGGSMYYYYTNL